MASGIPIHGHPWTRAPLVPESEGWTAPPPRSVEPIERVIAALDEVAGAPSILDGIRASASVRRAVAVGRSSPSTVRDLTTILAPAVHDRVDGVVAIAATQALATLPGVGAADLLGHLLATSGDPLAAHAAWALAGVPRRRPSSGRSSGSSAPAACPAYMPSRRSSAGRTLPRPPSWRRSIARPASRRRMPADRGSPRRWASSLASRRELG